MSNRGEDLHVVVAQPAKTFRRRLHDFLDHRREFFALVVVLLLLQVPVFLLSNGLTLNDVLRESGMSSLTTDTSGSNTTEASGPNWVAIFIAAAVVVFFVWGRSVWLRRLTIVVASFQTFVVVLFTLILVFTIGLKSQTGVRLLQDGVVVWTSIVLLFALWYWLIEGASAREKAAGKPHDIVFAEKDLSVAETGGKPWRPHIIDYVYLAFTVSTRFSPGTAIMLSRRAKLIQMLHAILSIIVLLVIAARAVSIA
ncbi:MAG TPA: hypothetical protein VH591_17775 [Ktedonobacterales bacterium]|jgi:hypothetical protein